MLQQSHQTSGPQLWKDVSSRSVVGRRWQLVWQCRVVGSFLLRQYLKHHYPRCKVRLSDVSDMHPKRPSLPTQQRPITSQALEVLVCIKHTLSENFILEQPAAHANVLSPLAGEDEAETCLLLNPRWR